MEGIIKGPIITNHHHFVPSTDVVTSIVLPTILFCIGMVVAMLIGINKCKQWELDKIVEMRRTRRVIQRITARLREKNFRTIQSNVIGHILFAACLPVYSGARSIRKRAAANKAGEGLSGKTRSRPSELGKPPLAPPVYHSTRSSHPCGASPPPTYEDSLLDQLYHECLPSSSEPVLPSGNHCTATTASKRRRSSANTASSSNGTRRNSGRRL